MNMLSRIFILLMIFRKKYIESAEIDKSANQNDFYSAKCIIFFFIIVIYVYNKLCSFLNRALNLCTDESCPVMKTLRYFSNYFIL